MGKKASEFYLKGELLAPFCYFFDLNRRNLSESETSTTLIMFNYLKR